MQGSLSADCSSSACSIPNIEASPSIVPDRRVQKGLRMGVREAQYIQNILSHAATYPLRLPPVALPSRLIHLFHSPHSLTRRSDGEGPLLAALLVSPMGRFVEQWPITRQSPFTVHRAFFSSQCDNPSFYSLETSYTSISFNYLTVDEPGQDVGKRRA